MKRTLLSLCLLVAAVLTALSCSSGGTVEESNVPSIVEDTGGGGGGGGDAVVEPPDQLNFDGLGPGDWLLPDADGYDPCQQTPAPFGCPCAGNPDCLSGYCIDSSYGFVCTDQCVEECPKDWQCKGFSGFGADIVFLCVPSAEKLCTPCAGSLGCGTGICLDQGDGHFCSVPCSDESPCPDLFDCVETELPGGSGTVCIPASGSCTCTKESRGAVRTCSVSNAKGICYGLESCDPELGWAGCDAPTPALEECNGKDDDCDGEVDEDVPPVKPCEVTVPGVGTCDGKAQCLGAAGWVCNAPIPVVEGCDFIDNDCDGEVDEDFKVGGSYGALNHCGTCNMDCVGAIMFATAMCDLSKPTPLCVVDECDPGYYKLNDFQCLPEGQKLCKPCVSDINCEGGKCADFSGGQFCTAGCAEEPCPLSFECGTIPGASGKWCLPTSGSCDCGKENAGATRPCSVTNGLGTCYGLESCDPELGWIGCTAVGAAAESCDGLDNDCNGIPDDGLPVGKSCELSEPGVGTCTGIEICLGKQGWSCSAPKPEPELCDFLDNDCDGQTDEDFKVGGKYGVIAHCGSCGKSCVDAVPFAEPYCDTTKPMPECKVKSCLPGYFKLNDYQCILPPETHCKECTSDGDCYFNKCVPLEKKKYCLAGCAKGCAPGTHCEAVAGYGSLCLPDTLSCECNSANAGLTSSCSQTNQYGTCFGVQTCQPPAGWSACNAALPKVEECDGVDNDCDGAIDEGLPVNDPCTIENEWGSCPGMAVCYGPLGFKCQANEPAPESCDYIDNNCNSQVDELFKDNAGKYASDDHCGTCNNSCLKAIAHAVGKCDPAYSVPKCVVATCDPGYFQVSPFQCIEPPDATCQSCEQDGDCFGAPCIFIDGKKRCAKPCPNDELCAPETECQLHPEEGKLCLPISGSCECNSFTHGSKRTCSATNGLGTCFGFETCNSLTGWSGCTAVPPQAEKCNGVDDDCNGQIDDGLPLTQPCANANQWGSCPGEESCLGSAGWVCQAPVPAPEICDYQDNDCDGTVDDGFINGQGQYVGLTHCGSCTISCEGGFPHATTKCDETKQPPKCVVDECEEGYFKLNEYQCIPDTANLCEPCSSDANCVLAGSKCITLEDGKFCSKLCANDGDCPSGYTCKPFSGTKQCFPKTNSCDCDGVNTALSRSCSVTWPVAPAPEEPFITCYGSQQCTPTGWSACQLPTEVCDAIDNDCNGTVDDGFLVNGKYILDGNCGQCGNNCTFLNYPNASGKCDSAPAIPECGMVCKQNYFDVNKNPGDGCECHYLSATDHPDGIDQNCDGVDGELNNAVFVAKNGKDSNPGTSSSPKLTIQASLDHAKAGNKRDVYVATGVYSESVLLQDGVRLYGGYSSDFLTRNTVLYETVIMAAPFSASKPGAVNAGGISGNPATTVVDGFTIFGRNNNTPGGSSYAVYIKNSNSGLSISNNRIVAANGGNGGNGTAGGEGSDGGDGKPGLPASLFNGKNCTSTDPLKVGGKGGGLITDATKPQVCNSVDVSGGKGGDSYCPAYGDPKAGEYGVAGKGPGGAGGDAGWDGYISVSCGMVNVDASKPADGEDGDPGIKGKNGDPGPGCTQAGGSVTGGLWGAGGGSAGTAGVYGLGGGGGGAGGGADVYNQGYLNCYDQLGGTGGGGGAGGCGGTPGTGGTGGGGSFGIFIRFDNPPTTIPTIKDNFIEGGLGGLGGSGGAGGTGGVGGSGGTGGAQGTGTTWAGRGGGTGGNGGLGGHGGGGGGGCGGVSYCIFASGQGGVNLSAYKVPNNFFAAGSGGALGLGGPSIGEKGKDGTAGTGAPTSF